MALLKKSEKAKPLKTANRGGAHLSRYPVGTFDIRYNRNWMEGS